MFVSTRYDMYARCFNRFTYIIDEYEKSGWITQNDEIRVNQVSNIHSVFSIPGSSKYVVINDMVLYDVKHRSITYLIGLRFTAGRMRHDRPEEMLANNITSSSFEEHFLFVGTSKTTTTLLHIDAALTDEFSIIPFALCGSGINTLTHMPFIVSNDKQHESPGPYCSLVEFTERPISYNNAGHTMAGPILYTASTLYDDGTNSTDLDVFIQDV